MTRRKKHVTHLLCVWNGDKEALVLCSGGKNWREDLGGLSLTRGPRCLCTGRRKALVGAQSGLQFPASLLSGHVRRWVSGGPCFWRSQDSLFYKSKKKMGEKEKQERPSMSSLSHCLWYLFPGACLHSFLKVSKEHLIVYWGLIWFYYLYFWMCCAVRTYPCSRETRRSPSSLPRNPLANGLFSIFSCVIWNIVSISLFILFKKWT